MADDPEALPDRITTLDGEVLSAEWSGDAACRAVAVLTHPHPLHGGDRHNIVLASLARALPAHGVATLRFDFRGAGESTGAHGGGTDEILDVAAAIDAAAAAFPSAAVVAVGYSFGADVLLATATDRLRGVVAVAPPLAILPVETLAAARDAAPTLLLCPEHDQFRPSADASDVVAAWPETSVVEIPGTDHFMAGATSFVADRIVEFVERVLVTD